MNLIKNGQLNCAGKNDNISNCIYENYTNSALKQLEFSLIKSIKNALNHRKKEKNWYNRWTW